MYGYSPMDYILEVVVFGYAPLFSVALLSVIAFFVYKKEAGLGCFTDCVIVILVFLAIVPRLVMLNLPFFLIIILTIAAEVFIFYLFLTVIANLKSKQRFEENIDSWFQKQKSNDNDSNDNL